MLISLAKGDLVVIKDDQIGRIESINSYSVLVKVLTATAPCLITILITALQTKGVMVWRTDADVLPRTGCGQREQTSGKEPR